MTEPVEEVGFQFGPRHLALAAVVAGVVALAMPEVKTDEGRKLIAYPDIGGIYTVCDGEAYVKAGTVKTNQQCDEMTGAELTKYTIAVVQGTSLDLPRQVLAADVAFAWNVGLGKKGFAGSRVRALHKAGDLVSGCKAMMDFHKTGGKDCRIAANKCYGLIRRRQRDINFCLAGITGGAK